MQFRKRLDLRYGENPHQQAAFYVANDAQGASVGSASQLQGKELSFNNLADADTALECVRQFDAPACVIVKHANPCGVSVAATIRAAYDNAYRTDPDLGVRRHHRVQPAARRARRPRAIVERQFVEVIIAPSVEREAREVCAMKQNVRAARDRGRSRRATAAWRLRSVNGGLLLQTRDLGMVAPADFKVVTKRAPTAQELLDLTFAWQVCKYVKSNAIIFARDGMTIGIGAGQMSRVYSTRIAAMKARDGGLEPAGCGHGVRRVLPVPRRPRRCGRARHQGRDPAGRLMRDAEVIAAADEHGIAMVFTGMRHFRH